MTVINKATGPAHRHGDDQQQRPAALTSGEGPSVSDRRSYGRSLGAGNDLERTGDGDNDIGANDVDDIPMPGCHMKIFSGDNVAENVKIGDPLKLMVTIDKQNVYGLHVTDCLVRDGLGWGEQTLVNNVG